MAATNYTPIQLYYSTTASAAPAAGNLVNGELAINITDGKLYYKDNGGNVQVIATKGAGTIGGSNTQIQFNDGGALAGNAAMVFNKATNVTTLTTLNLTNALGATYGGTAQSAYAQGDLLYASAVNTLSKLTIGTVNYILTSTGSVPQWVAPTSVTVQTANNLAGGAAGSVPYQSAADTTTFLAIGAANRVMTSTGSAPQWVTSLTGLTGVSSSSITNTGLTSGRVVYSGASGVQTDSSNLTFNGTTLSAGGFSTTGNSTLVKLVTIGDSSFTTGAVLAAATPAKLYIGTGAVTDGTSAGGATNTLGTITAFGQTQVIATNANVTYTNLATLYVAGAPTAGTNVTITNPYALYVAAGDAYFGGTVTAGTVNLTTLDLTNLEVTNIKAKDGTASITLADTTGVASFNANPVLSGGTANGVAYLNGSKVLTTGSALTFDGTNLGVGTNSPLSVSGYTFTDMLGSTGAQYRARTTTVDLRVGADALLAFVSSTNSSLWFGANNAEGMRLTSTGLGIGTSSPGVKLETATARSATVTSAIFGTTGTGVIGDQNRLIIKNVNTASGQNFGVGIGGLLEANASNAASLLFYYDGGAALLEGMRLNSSGNLGIGTSSPTQKLDVNGLIRAYQTTASAQIFAQNTGGSIYIARDSSTGSNFGSAYSANIYCDGAYPLLFWTNATERMRLDSSGNLGVGRTSIVGSSGGQTIEASGCLVAGGPLLSNQTSRGVFEFNSDKTSIRSYGATAGTGFIAFGVGGGGGSADTEAARINSGGNFLLTGGFIPSNTSRLVVRGFTGGSYNNSFSQSNATTQIISDEMGSNIWYPTLNIAMVRQSLTTGGNAFGGIGFSCIDDSNDSGQYDAARIAIVNEQGSSVLSGTAMAFYTQVGAVSNTNPASERARITSGGNLLVGTTTDGQKLTVEGNQRFTGSQVGTKIENRQTAVSVSTATTILDEAGALGRFVIVNGEISGNRFCDLVLCSTSVSPTVVASFTSLGSPAARTYTRSGGALQLAMASGTYTVTALALGY